MRENALYDVFTPCGYTAPRNRQKARIRDFFIGLDFRSIITISETLRIFVANNGIYAMQSRLFTFKDLYLLNHLFWSFIFSDKKFRILYLRILLFVILFKHQVN
jgi:hypothetical protein